MRQTVAHREAHVYVPAWQVLRPGHVLRPAPEGTRAFPLDVPGAWHFYLARNAIYHLIRALGLRDGDTVLAPAYHSGNEVRAIAAAGATLRFFGIDRNLEPDMDELARLIEAGPRVVYLIHFLGWPQPVREVMRLCRPRGIVVVEDCALSLLSEVDGRPLGSIGDYGVFCLYKTLPVPNGGVLVENGPPLDGLSRLRLVPPGRVATAGRSVELAIAWVRSRWEPLGGALSAGKAAIGRFLDGLHVERVPVGDMGFEIANVDLAMSPISRRLLRHFDCAAIRGRRRANYTLLRDELAGRATFVDKPLAPGVCPLFFPLLVPDKAGAARALRAHGIEAVEFWNRGDPAASGVAFPDVEFLRRHLLELPIHQDVTDAQIRHVAAVVRRLGLRL